MVEKGRGGGDNNDDDEKDENTMENILFDCDKSAAGMSLPRRCHKVEERASDDDVDGGDCGDCGGGGAAGVVAAAVCGILTDLIKLTSCWLSWFVYLTLSWFGLVWFDSRRVSVVV